MLDFEWKLMSKVLCVRHSALNFSYENNPKRTM